MYFKGFFVKNLRLLFVCGGVSPCQVCQLLNHQPAFLLSISPSSSINDRSFIYFVLLIISPQHPRYQDFKVSLISQPSSIPFSSSLWLLFISSYQPPWIGFNNICIFFWTANIHLRLVQHCRFDNFGSFVPSGPHATTFILSSCRCCLRLHIIAVFVDVFAFISVSSSWPSSPLFHRRLVLAVFAFVSSLSWPSFSTLSLRRRHVLRPSRREVTVDRRPAYRDRPQWPSPQGALGNAPVGTSLCRCGGGFLRVCIPCNGFRHRVSPDLSSDKSHLVRDPYDAILSYCSLSNLRVAWPGSQRCDHLARKKGKNDVKLTSHGGVTKGINHYLL
ncbi:hypothetical protein OUZ56_029076 [Daphnia magna]|uniref:Uncharacterized protein n=1 Tax=Daphnia magna TaxID=35525 RepID=A0ABR0B5R2_9CRUS|nr:hypothetical protein OUZ56_029076 [Daphnia magna]